MAEIEFIQRVNELAEQQVELCYHCHKCTSGCPVVAEMVYGPDRLLRLVQLGQVERVLSSPDIWVCASCETCATRCPNEISVIAVMDALRSIAMAERHATPEPGSPNFHRLFLGLLQQFGRMHEASLMMLYKFKTMNLLGDMDSGIPMILKGKIPILPHRVKDMDEVRRIYRESMNQ